MAHSDIIFWICARVHGCRRKARDNRITSARAFDHRRDCSMMRRRLLWHIFLNAVASAAVADSQRFRIFFRLVDAWAGCFDDARRRGSEDIAEQIGGRESSPVSMTLANLTGQTINAKASFRTRENRRKEKRNAGE
jgi:hypothetical protein